jgi:hypothetical protein
MAKTHRRPPRNDAQRAARYNGHLIAARVAAIITTRMPSMQAGMAAFLPKEETIRAKIGALLAPHAVGAYKIGQYQAYGLEIWRLSTKFAGAAAPDIVLTEAKWAARGLAAAQLKQIALDLTGVVVP